MLNTVKVPKEFEPVFEIAHQYVSKYFSEKREDPSKGTIEIFGERYILVRAASMSVDFFETIKNLYKDRVEQEALNIARQFLFDIAHAIGKQDAKIFHEKMNMKDPIEKLSIGPVHFSHTGWAFVDIFPESKPSPDDNYYLIYDHPFSFESDAWIKSDKKTDFPVCVMNAGYSSGWCEQSFGISLVASEIMCKAKGDEACRFIMAHPSKIEGYIRTYLEREPEIAKSVTKFEVPGFFRRKQIEDALRESEYKFRTIFDNAGGAIFLFDVQTGRILDCNIQAERLIGRSRDETVSMSLSGFNPLVEFNRFEEIVTLASRDNIIDFENKVQHKDGRKIPVLIRARTMEIGGRSLLMGLFLDITERKKSEKEREGYLREISERVKELNCLYVLSELSDRSDLSLEQIFQEIVDIIPSAWQYPDIACARIIFEEKEFKTEKFKVSASRQSSDIKVYGKIVGSVEVFYLEERSQSFEGPFLKEERYLLNTIAERIGEIVERRGAEDQLRDNEKYFRALTDNSSDIIMVLDQKGDITYISNFVEVYLGYAPEELIGKSVFQFIMRDDSANILLQFEEMLKHQNAIRSSELRIRHKDGRERIFEGIAKNFIEKEKMHRIIINARDITERKKSEEEMASLKRQIEFILGATKTGLDIIDSNFNIVYIDPEWQMTYGEFRDKKCYEYFMNSDSVCPNCAIPQALKTKKPVVSEGVLPREKYRHVQVTSIPFQNKNGDWMVAEVNADITEQKKKEQELRDAYLRLRDTQDKLIQAEKFNAIGRLASGIAHEVRNPLGTILQGVSYLEQILPSEKKDVLDTLSTIKKNIERANGIIGALLDFSKATGLFLKREDINIILESSLLLLKHHFTSVNIEIIKQTKSNIPKVLIDKSKMEQVFINLFLNSIQAMPRGGKLFIRSYDKQLEEVGECIDSKGDVFFSIGEKVVVVEVEDAGAGILEEDLKRIFDPFFTTKGPGKGIGLGLSVTQSIIFMHKGMINIQSQIGKGTKVTITLKQ